MATRVPLLLGSSLIGLPGLPNVRISDIDESQEIIDTYLDHGHDEIDTAKLYGDQTSEQALARLDLGHATVDTKIFPYPPGSHAPEALRRAVTHSVSIFATGGKRIRTLYLHAPDPQTPFEDTLGELDRLYREGMFEQLGLSNFAAWEVALIATTCRERGYIMPSVYQGRYNLLARGVEDELIPCLRRFGIRFVIYNQLAGGLLTGKYLTPRDANNVEKNCRYDPTTANGQRYRARYMNHNNWNALQVIKAAIEPEGLTFAETALRWCQHHSVLTEDDGVILGVSRLSQLEESLSDSEKGPLPPHVVEALEEAWRIAAPTSPAYHKMW